jgi:hypothetical protein
MRVSSYFFGWVVFLLKKQNTKNNKVKIGIKSKKV